ncbi:MAG: rRNA maturation RNase YbeY [Oscillatoriales cyanobacterium]|nr:MAG: rRNA maturation RNase YbeY [Oscillatoriales cyanobacterium]
MSIPRRSISCEIDAIISPDTFASDLEACGKLDAPEVWVHRLQQWLGLLADDLPPAIAYEVSLQFTDDQEVRELNAAYRQQDRSTDVLSFAAIDADLPRSPDLPFCLGDIIISVETAERQAAERNHTLTEELVWLAAHGLLHLLGWDHPDEASLRTMLEQQNRLLEAIGYSIPYDEPVS